jgi:tetratricopeptide (TPR) repeat protein
MGSEHHWLAQTLSTRAGLWIELGDLGKAEEDIDEAARILAAHSGTDTENYGGILLLRGRLGLERGELSVAEGELRRARDLIQPVAALERTPIDALEWQLARVLALQGRAEGGELARSVIARMADRLAAADWRLRIKRTALSLPPFNPAPSLAQVAASRTLLSELSERYGAQAPRLVELSDALAGLP